MECYDGPPVWQEREIFVRKFVLPENVDLEALRTQLNDKGHLSVEAPKVGESGSKRRNIPIMAAPSANHNHK
ncbi:hypothetical protein KIN20_014381 [Parelaphostrongylus tenuis]|uniref:SHSP domain-containing protein n=1 Tax=Parelaphostrongylus tenuis TaxID=148309 RepID=A0AAD5MDJ4_PARTN|nr:hypothetical protein KIN20_014381 [Parelaphostrongylus tenuis]